MAKKSRRLSRLAARERRRKESDREKLGRRFQRRASLVFGAAVTILVGSGVVSEWASLAGSAVASAFESAPDVSTQQAELSTAQFETVVPKSEEEIRARWERLAERRQEIEDSSREVVRARRVVPALQVGTTASALAAARVPPLVSVEEQLAPLAREDGPWRRALERVDADQNARDAEF